MLSPLNWWHTRTRAMPSGHFVQAMLVFSWSKKRGSPCCASSLLTPTGSYFWPLRELPEQSVISGDLCLNVELWQQRGCCDNQWTASQVKSQWISFCHTNSHHSVTSVVFAAKEKTSHSEIAAISYWESKHCKIHFISSNNLILNHLPRTILKGKLLYA